MVVYIDCVFLLNSLIDGLLLYFTGYLAGVERKIFRLLLAALLGGIYAVAVFFPFGAVLAWVPVKLLAGMAMVFFSYGKHYFGKLFFAFCGLSCGLAGLVFACSLLCETQLIYGGVYLLPVRFSHLAAGTVLCFALLYCFFRGSLRHRMEGGIIKVSCEIAGQEVTLRTLLDSGNTLCDDITGAPVLVVEGAVLLPVWPEDVRPYLTNSYLGKPAQTMAALEKIQEKPALRLLPYRSVGTASGMLLACTACHAKIGIYQREKLTVALSPTPVSERKEFDALWGGPVR